MSTAAGTGAARDETVRTYGGWRRSRGIGIGGLTSAQSLVVLAALVAPLVAFSVQPVAGLVLAPGGLIVAAATVTRRDGVYLTDALAARLDWWRTRRAGENTYRTTTEHPRAWQLPGLLAPLRLLSVTDGASGSYGLVWNRRTGLLTGTLRVAATGSLLAERADVDTWVANWGGFLADLGNKPAVTWIAVTVATAPDPGSTVGQYVLPRLSPSAPPAAVEVLTELAGAATTPTARVETTVSITVDPSRTVSHPSSLPEAVAEVDVVLADLQSSLAGCGLTVVGRAGAAWLARTVRAAYDPSAAPPLDGGSAGTGESMEWADAGPVAADEGWDSYRHDGAMSVSWALREGPRQQVTSDVLAKLVAPGNWPRRVTLVYRAYPAATAAGIAEREINAAHYRELMRQVKKRDPSARDTDDAERARRSAAEEATGAGIGLVGLYVTTTVTDPGHLRLAVADVEEQRSGAAKLRLRRMYAGQAVGFAATLPLGVYPPHALTRARRH